MTARNNYMALCIVCIAITYVVDYNMDQSVVKGMIMLFSSSISCFSFLKAVTCRNDEKE